MKWSWLKTLNWYTVLVALLAAGIVHICIVLAMPHLASTSAYDQLAPLLPENELVILPPASAGQQALPLMTPDIRTAICRFDITRGPVTVTARLLDPSWTLAIYSPLGDNFYVAPGLAARQLDVTFELVPPGELFLGIFSTGRGAASDRIQVQAPEPKGLLVLRAPIGGTAFSAQVEDTLKRAACRKARD